MTNNFRMSYSMPPIAPTRNEQRQTVTPATFTPFCEVSIEQVYQMITCSENLKTLTEQVRNAGDLRVAGASLLPYITPCGTFVRRGDRFFTSPSGLIAVGIDSLDSYQKTVEVHHTLFDDLLLCPILTFISPNGRNVRAFIPYSRLYADDQIRNVKESINWAVQYVEITYRSEIDDSTETPPKAVDTSDEDIIRACFLDHDPQVLFREY